MTELTKQQVNERISKLRLLREGLRRHSRVRLDAAGCPLWFQRLWCPVPTTWGEMLLEFAYVFELGDEQEPEP